AAMMLTAARKALSADDLLPEQRALRGELATYLATLAFFREEPAEVIQAAEEALTYLPPEALVRRARAVGALGLGVGLTGDTRRAVALWHEAVEMARLGGNPFLLAHSLEMVADGQLHSGQLHASAATCREIIALGTQGYVTPLPFVGNGRIRLAAIYLEWGQLLQAEEEMAAGLALVQQGGIGYNALPELCTQARLRQALGDDERALAILRQAEAYYRHSPSRIALITLTACAVQYWLNVGDVATAVSWAEGQHLNEPVPLADLPIIAQEVQQISLARVRRAQQKPEAVLAIFNRLHDQAQAAGRVARVIEMSLLAALAYEMMGETAVALDKLNQVLALTRPEGYVQIFVEAGAPMLHLLRQLPADATDTYVQTLQHAFPESLQVASATLVEPLSLRELEVLQLIAAGLSNKQIMAELTVSLNTVKKHTTHIYGKLGVNGRTQAIVRARELHLI
ncbi:MAG: hypothetical protein KC434_15640, partial [Anaerolineales bacterium]|nr:hypothetical protein [Anaerolineales bacterium]